MKSLRVPMRLKTRNICFRTSSRRFKKITRSVCHHSLQLVLKFSAIIVLQLLVAESTLTLRQHMVQMLVETNVANEDELAALTTERKALRSERAKLIQCIEHLCEKIGVDPASIDRLEQLGAKVTTILAQLDECHLQAHSTRAS